MRIGRPPWVLRRRHLVSGLLAVILPLCLLAGAPTAAAATAQACQPQALTPDFCTKFTHPSDVVGVIPEAVVSEDGSSLTPQILTSSDTLKHPLPGYLTAPSGRSPPLF